MYVMIIKKGCCFVCIIKEYKYCREFFMIVEVVDIGLDEIKLNLV